MGFKIHGKIKLGKGIYLNYGKNGITSVSGKFGRTTVTKKRNGGTKVTTKICKGLSYESTFSKKNKKKK